MRLFDQKSSSTSRRSFWVDESRQMPRYFFHTANSVRERDTEGTELPDHKMARLEAIKLVGGLLSQQPQLLFDSADFYVEVTDAQGMLLFRVVASAIDSPAFNQS